MKYKLPDLTYDYGDLEPHIDKKTMKIHHLKHHAGYVEKLNAALDNSDKVKNMQIEELLVNIEKVDKEQVTAVKNNGGGHHNHSLFWKVMTPGGSEAKGSIEKMIKSTFGSFSTFKERFTNEALNRFGSGWAWLVIKNDKLTLKSTANQDSPISEECTPLLGIDVWEHAYYLKYQNKRAEYVQAWWNIVDWNQVERNFREHLNK